MTALRPRLPLTAALDLLDASGTVLQVRDEHRPGPRDPRDLVQAYADLGHALGARESRGWHVMAALRALRLPLDHTVLYVRPDHQALVYTQPYAAWVDVERVARGFCALTDAGWSLERDPRSVWVPGQTVSFLLASPGRPRVTHRGGVTRLVGVYPAPGR